MMGYFESTVTISSSCSEVCLSCTSLLLCGSCSPTYFLRSDNMCYAFCLTGTYTDNQNGRCQPCPSGCLSCTSNSTCTACLTGNYLQPNQLCSSSCAARSYGNTLTTRCEACPYDCYTCDQNSNCLSCNSTQDFRSLDQLTSRCVPLPGYFDDSVSVVCGQCASGCSVCSNGTFCTSCFVDFYLRGDQLCYSTCLAYFFANRNSLTCDPCPYDCYTCTSTGNCLSCNDTVDFRTLNTSTSRCVPLTGYF